MNHLRQAQVKARSDAGEFAAGHWWCRCCAHITVLDVDQEINKCWVCGSTRVSYQAARTELASPVTMDRASSWFALMRRQVDGAPG
jgi:hypothetical protein